MPPVAQCIKCNNPNNAYTFFYAAIYCSMHSYKLLTNNMFLKKW